MELEIMPEQVQKILTKITDWWKKFTTKQRILLGSIVAVIILALVILAVVVGKPNMVTLIECSSTAQAGEVKDLLDNDGSISYQMSDDGLTFYVDEKDNAAASILLGQNGVPTEGFSIDNVFSGGFSSTEADKTKKYKLYLENYFAGLAQYIATQLGNDTTDNVLILDSNSNVLFSGGDSDSSIGTASSQLSLKTKTENLLKSEVKDVLVGSGLYDHAEVAAKLDMNFDAYRETERQYSAPDGQTNGMIDEQSNYESNSVGGAAATPGTDSNDDTSYVIEDNNYTESTITDTTTKYQNNEKVTDRTAATGTINYDTSSIAIVVKNYVIYDEDTLRTSGALDNMTFDEYIAANSDPVKTTVDQDNYTMIANATGFPEANISVIAYDEPIFQYSSGGRTLSDYLQIILAVLILLLLGYVVFRSTRKEKQAEMEEELSVESLLESTKENQEPLEDIGYNEKSETRLLIEKFVEEKPEAAASLLRNWLNEEWE